MMGNLIQDLRYGFRMLWKNPGFTFAAVLALALGIGANTAIFSIVNNVVFRPLPYADPDRLVMLAYAFREVSPANFLDWREQNQSFEQVAAVQFWDANLTGDGEPERLQGFAVSPSMFPMLGAQPLMGRTFLPEEESPGKDGTVLLSHGIWQRRFGSDPNIVGRTLTINTRPRTVVGVMPPDFRFYQPAEMWIPLPFGPDAAAARRANYLVAVGRLKPGVSLDQAQADMTNVARRLEQTYPETNAGSSIKLVSAHEYVVGSIRPALWILMAAVGFVLLIACANVANLLLARAATRQKEIAIRLAMGATRGRLIRQLLTESTLLALIGGGLGLLLAMWGLSLLISSMPAGGMTILPRAEEVGINGTVLGFSLLVSVLTGLVFGFAPALQTSKLDLNDTLKDSGRGTSGGSRGRRLRSMLVVVEVALSLVLLISAGLMIRSFARLLEVNPGFETRNLLSTGVALSRAKYKTNEQITAFYQQVLERIKSLPGVQSASITSALPLSGTDASGGFLIEGRPEPPPANQPVAKLRTIGPEYFRTLGIPLQRGRLFTEQDGAAAPGVVIINESMAKRFWPDEDPLGKRVKLSNPNSVWAEIVGVVGDVRHSALNVRPSPELYQPFLQNPLPGMMLAIRTSTDPTGLTPSVRSQVFSIDKDQPVSNVRTMDKIISDSVHLNRFAMVLLGIFAGVALILAAVGIYSVMSYSVTQRSHEIGIRMALGAKPRSILKMVVGNGMVLALVGLGIGLLVAFGVTRLMASLLYGVSVSDPWSFGAVTLLMAAVAVVASYIPARRATRVNPATALREE